MTDGIYNKLRRGWGIGQQISILQKILWHSS